MRNAAIHPQRRRPLAPAIALTLLLGGCSIFRPDQPVVVTPPPVPEPVACVDPAQIPPEPPTVGQRFNGDAKHDLQVLAPSAKALREWGQQLRTMLDACAPKPAEDAAADTAAAKP